MDRGPSSDLLDQLWAALGGDPELTSLVALEGPVGVLPSIFDVTGFAAASVGVASLATAEFQAARAGTSTAGVTVNRRAASAAFRGELLFTPIGWERPSVWDPIAGDYCCSDGWIKLHTNYRTHRRAVETVLGGAGTRPAGPGAPAGLAGPVETTDSDADGHPGTGVPGPLG